jgi:hypothetical protein
VVDEIVEEEIIEVAVDPEKIEVDEEFIKVEE